MWAGVLNEPTLTQGMTLAGIVLIPSELLSPIHQSVQSPDPLYFRW